MIEKMPVVGKITYNGKNDLFSAADDENAYILINITPRLKNAKSDAPDVFRINARFTEGKLMDDKQYNQLFLNGRSQDFPGDYSTEAFRAHYANIQKALDRAISARRKSAMPAVSEEIAATG